MLGELFAPNIKGLAGSISTTSSLALAFISTKTHDTLTESFGISGTFWLYTVFSLLGIIFVYFVVPETTGKSLYSIQQMLSDDENMRFFSRRFMESGANQFQMKTRNSNSNKFKNQVTSRT